MEHPNLHFSANGKLLLTAEYFVTDGAVALALPTKLGQQLTIKPGGSDNMLHWTSFHKENETWFDGRFDLNSLSCLESSGHDDHEQVAETLTDILCVARKMNPDFFWFDLKCLIILWSFLL